MRIRVADEWIAGINVMLLRLDLTAHILAPTILSLLIRTISTRRRPAIIFSAQFFVGTHHSILRHFVPGIVVTPTPMVCFVVCLKKFCFFPPRKFQSAILKVLQGLVSRPIDFIRSNEYLSSPSVSSLRKPYLTSPCERGWKIGRPIKLIGCEGAREGGGQRSTDPSVRLPLLLPLLLLHSSPRGAAPLSPLSAARPASSSIGI